MNGKQIVTGIGLCLFLTLTGLFYGYLYESRGADVLKWDNSLNQDLRLRDGLVNATKCTNDLIIGTVKPVSNLRKHFHAYVQVKEEECMAKNHVVFLKTHKTGSTTVASIFERYGYYNNLTFALPKSRHFFTPVQDLFNSRNMAQVSGRYIAAFRNHSWAGYNLLTNHARYNRPEMDAVVHNATYVTILRSPVQQFESTFGYYEMAKYLGLKKAKDPISSFMEKPQYYFGKHFTAWYWSKNAQLYDLGLEHVHHKDPYTLSHKIRQLDFEFDLVMLIEYFDESLLLLRRILCWRWDDILYFPKGVRSRTHRYEMSLSLKGKILAWNDADVQLYNHFNKTLWQKIRQYGPSFEEDLIFFRSTLKKLEEECIDKSKMNEKDKREEKSVLKTGAADICHRVYRDDVSYTELIRKKMIANGFLAKQPKQYIKTVKYPAAKSNRYVKKKKAFMPKNIN